MSEMRKVEVTIGGPLSGDATLDALEALGDGVMEALIDLGAEDPFVAADGSRMWLTVQLIVTATSGSHALSIGGDLLAKALEAAGYEEVPGDELVTNASTKVLELV